MGDSEGLREGVLDVDTLSLMDGVTLGGAVGDTVEDGVRLTDSDGAMNRCTARSREGASS